MKEAHNLFLTLIKTSKANIPNQNLVRSEGNCMWANQTIFLCFTLIFICILIFTNMYKAANSYRHCLYLIPTAQANTQSMQQIMHLFHCDFHFDKQSIYI